MTSPNRAAASTLAAALPSVRLVAASFLDPPPDGVTKFAGTVPSGCTFWHLAVEGDGFYTVPADHFNCPIGSYTHAIDLPPDRDCLNWEIFGFGHRDMPLFYQQVYLPPTTRKLCFDAYPKIRLDKKQYSAHSARSSETVDPEDSRVFPLRAARGGNVRIA